MGWTFKKSDDTPVIVTADKDELHKEVEVVFDENICYDNCGEDRQHPETGEPLTRISVQEYNTLAKILPPTSMLMGNGWTGQDTEMESRRRKALEKNPMHTTMKDYKTSNPDSVVSKARDKNLKRMKKRNVDVKRNKTKYS